MALAVVRSLVDRGADVNAMSNGGRTVLHWAARNGHLSVVKVLVGAGADKERRRQTKKVTVAQKAEYWGVSKRRMEQALWLEKNHPFLFELWWGAPVTWHKDEWTDRFDRIIRLRGLVSCAQRILRAEGTGDERQMGAAYRAAYEYCYWRYYYAFGVSLVLGRALGRPGAVRR